MKIGIVDFGDSTAELSTTGWESDSQQLQQYLNTAFGRDQYSPAHGSWGVKLIHDAAEKLGGQATIYERDHVESTSEKLASFFGFTKAKTQLSLFGDDECGANGPGGHGFQPGNVCGGKSKKGKQSAPEAPLPEGFTKESACGANGPGGQGFQPGNNCAAEDGDGGDDYNPDKENLIPDDGPSQHSDMLHNIKTDPTKQDRAELLQFAKDVATFKIRKDSLLRRAIKELTTDPTAEDRGRAFKYAGDVLTLKPAADFITGKNRGPNPAGDDLKIITGGVRKVVNATVGKLVRLVGRSIADSRASGPAIPDRVNNHRVPMMVRSFTKAVETDGQDSLIEQITDEVLRRAGDYTDADVVQEAILDVMEEVLSGEFPETGQTVGKAGGISGTTGSSGGFLQGKRAAAVESDWLNHEFDPDDYDPPERDR